MVFQTQVPISLVILVIGIQDLYTSKYKYTISTDNSSNKTPIHHIWKWPRNLSINRTAKYRFAKDEKQRIPIPVQ